MRTQTPIQHKSRRPQGVSLPEIIPAQPVTQLETLASDVDRLRELPDQIRQARLVVVDFENQLRLERNSLRALHARKYVEERNAGRTHDFAQTLAAGDRDVIQTTERVEELRERYQSAKTQLRWFKDRLQSTLTIVKALRKSSA